MWVHDEFWRGFAMKDFLVLELQQENTCDDSNLPVTQQSKFTKFFSPNKNVHA
jgi:hypothetical protein